MIEKLDTYFSSEKSWNPELTKLRAIIKDCTLEETIKWKQPCFTFGKSNIVMLGRFKEYCAISFFKGALLADSEQILEAPGENSQSVRLIKFTNLKSIEKSEATIKAYIIEALEIEKLGLKIPMKKTADFDYPLELTQKFTEQPILEEAFKNLTPGRQRGYLLHFSNTKQSKTTVARIEKYTERIIRGKGINDCTCGLSKRMPGCDGSHRKLT